MKEFTIKYCNTHCNGLAFFSIAGFFIFSIHYAQSFFTIKLATFAKDG